MVVLDAVARLLPGVINETGVTHDESFTAGILQHAVYTRPPVFRGLPVPRTLLSGNSAYDQYVMGVNEDALSAKAQNGLRVFVGKGQCLKCHFGFNFTDEKFHNLGVGWDNIQLDAGRYAVTKNPREIGAFKTPTLREIYRTAPYMHNGRFATLQQVIEFYNQGGIQNPYLDPAIKPLNLNQQEKEDLVEFLYTLNGQGWQVTPPTKFPN